MANSIQKSGLTVAGFIQKSRRTRTTKSQGAFELSARAVQFFKTCTGKFLRIWGNFRQKDFEEKNILCIFATNCNINK